MLSWKTKEIGWNKFECLNFGVWLIALCALNEETYFSNKSNTYVLIMLLKLFGLKYENSTHFLRLLFAQFNIFFWRCLDRTKKSLLVSTIRACDVLFHNSLGKILFGLLTCSWHQKNETTNSPTHTFKGLQNVFLSL